MNGTDAGVTRVESLQQLLTSSDCITLHSSHDQHSSRPIINQCTLRQMRRGLNTVSGLMYDRMQGNAFNLAF